MFKLIKYRDAGMSTYTYFWVDRNERCVSPFFNTEQEALKWNMQDEWDDWKPIKEFV